ncbi:MULTISPECIES: hypothetical protein [unclassified Mesorhizobium]|uniref:hypothetical protein n=1 Tax=unclassified Mesorhizobium TaxID=325217 RepID=UPI000FCBF423|nr:MULTISPECIES: hypothetical protein [unclassified Mesorhizobium]RUV47244.1 hypothetical protein EOB77_28880 [Mesorhizobium sp. M7A.F.Ca.MR.228.00.0.0]RUU79077.1 hypothetical protein EOC06_17490 [Mesorhizobium sp. M7A.F.Ca.MR.362.00.0.0]RUV18247.1 hypothetical protein EOB80_24205 [Mesorhizobium sp. M7A.F.Ca.MR.245.00.0.0]RWN97674.1 MAG: hypothetical protein EOS05_07165 [Mesorhizobium sp.]RWO39728.1 MAG: hypothetical protein EOS12_27130 [Mesorhizobium sp.]
MSIIVLNSSTPRPAWLVETLDWLRHARIAIRLARRDITYQNVEDLSDRQLRDIGGERRDVARAMDRELGRLGLLDIGWQRPRRSGNRQ